MIDEKKAGTAKFWGGVFLGGLMGAGLMFLLGTKEGKRTQRILKDKGEDLIDDLEEKLEELKDKGRDLMKEGEKIKEKMVEQLAEKKEELSDEVADRLDNALAGIEEVQEKGLETTTHLRKRLFKNAPKK